MITQFSEAELNQLAFQPVPRGERPSAYLEEREQVWSAHMETVLARGGKMWNGEVYTLESILSTGDDQVVLGVSTCEYKDIMFWFLKGQAYLEKQYGARALLHFMGVNCVPQTRDGKFVFGIRADRQEQGPPPLGSIGGTLNKDELEIHTFADIRQCMLREIEEETALEHPPENLRFVGLYGASYTYQFWFTLRLAVHSEQIHQFHRPGEFSSLVALTQQEVFATRMPITSGVRRLRPYLHMLPRVLDGLHPAVF